MAVDIGPKIGIEGEAKFRQEINQTNQALKTLAAEGKAVTSAFNDETTAEQKAAAQKDVLTRKVETQKDKLALLEKGLRESAQMYGEADTRTMKWQQAVHEATAQLNNMEKELNGVDKAVDETSDSMADAGQAAKGWADVMKGQLLADAVKAGLSKLAELTKQVMSAMWEASKAGAAYADDIQTMAAVTGLSTQKLQEYKYMADLVDVSLDTITGSMTKLTSAMNKARAGKGDAADAFAALGVAFTDSAGQLRKAEDVFNDALTALGKVENETERDAMAMTIFGKSAKELNPLIAAGADRLSKLAKEAKDTGYVLNGAALNALSKQQDAMDRLDKKAEALQNNFAAKLAPGVTKAYDAMGKAFDNPRVQRGAELIAQGIGSIIEKAAELASNALPKLFNIMDMGDVRLRTFSDDELKLAASIDESSAAYEEAMRTYRESADTIVRQTERTQSLWKELQTMADESGKVKEADRERANFILSQLNEALGTEYSMNDGIIGQYRTMQDEIDNLIAKREAEALMAAGADSFAEQSTKREQALKDAGAAKEKLDQATADLEAARKERDAAEKAWMEYEGESDALLKAYNAAIGKVNDLTDKVGELESEYNTASQTAQGLYSSVERWERAQAAAANGNYQEAVRLLTDEFGVTLEFYAKKRTLSEQDKKDLKEKIKDQELTIAEYKRNLDKGLTGFSYNGLRELQEYVDVAKKILDGEYVAANWLDGLERGLSDVSRMRSISAAAMVAPSNIIRTTKEILVVKSPSRVASWITNMWDEGLIKGLKDREAEVAKASEGVSDALVAAGTADAGLAYTYGNDLTASGYGAAANTYTTNLGGITVRIDGAGAVNEDVLAQRVALRLTEELRRTQRGGRT